MRTYFHFLQENLSFFERRFLYENFFLEHDFKPATPEKEVSVTPHQDNEGEKRMREKYEQMQASINTGTIRHRDIPFLLANPHPVLKEGEIGKEVALLKATLLFLQYRVDTTQMNTFSQKDILSVQEFQYNNSLMTDGVVGNATWKALQTAVEQRTGKSLKKIPVGTDVGNGIVIGENTNAWREDPIEPELTTDRDSGPSFRMVNRQRADQSFENAYKRRVEEITRELVRLKREYRSTEGDTRRRMEIMDKIQEVEKQLLASKKALDDIKKRGDIVRR
jgi:hypothetical protein